MNTTRRQLIAASSALAVSTAAGLRVSAAVAQDTTLIRWWHITTNEEQARVDAGRSRCICGGHSRRGDRDHDPGKRSIQDAADHRHAVGRSARCIPELGGGVLYQYAEAGLVRDLTDALAIDGWGESFSQSGLGLWANEGRNYGVPWNLGLVGFWYSKSKFAEAGIEAPPATWTELLADVDMLKAAGITPISLGGGDKWPIHFYWVYLAIRNGGKAAFDAAYTREGSFTDEPFVKAGADLIQLAELEPFQEGFLGQRGPIRGWCTPMVARR